MAAIRVRLLLFLAFAALGLPAPALAQGCTWGTPGYRDCVDEMIRKRREAEAAGQKPPVTPTAPANRRAPALTPLSPGDIQVLAPPAARSGPPSRTRDNQRTFDDSLSRSLRSRDIQPIMPPLRNPLPPMPGQICPSQGC